MIDKSRKRDILYNQDRKQEKCIAFAMQTKRFWCNVNAMQNKTCNVYALHE